MAKRKEVHQPNVFLLGNNQSVIRDAANAARWNPALAIDWMQAVAHRMVSPIEIALWNITAEKINSTMDDIESMINYSQSEYWKDSIPCRLDIQEMEYSLEDYIALQTLAE